MNDCFDFDDSLFDAVRNIVGDNDISSIILSEYDFRTIIDAVLNGLCVYKYQDDMKNIYLSPDIVDIMGMPVEDLEKKKMLRREIKKHFYINKLTGLYNFDGFAVEAERLLNKNPNDNFFIIVRDINGFKVFNQLYGRSKGDEFLRYFADNLKGFVAERGGICGYIGEDDFVAIYKSDCIDEVNNVSKKMTEALKKFYIDYSFIDTVGIYKVESRKMPVKEMCDKAVLALEEAKKNSLNYCVYDNEIGRKLIESQEIVNDFDSAMKNREIQVYIQPQYNVFSGNIVGGEALVRWNHPTKGVMFPGEFIPELEKNGLMGRLDRYVTDEVFALMKFLDENIEGKIPPAIAVNLSGRDIFSPGLLNDIEAMRLKYNLKSYVVRFEITESVYVSQPKYMIEFINKMRSAGYRIEMDDFGSGYSSLNALKDLDIDLLKLDMKFLTSINTDKGRKIIEAVVALADAISVPVLTEGVETAEQAEFLRSIGCKYAQGYFYSKPITVNEYVELVRSNDYEYIVKKCREFEGGVN